MEPKSVLLNGCGKESVCSRLSHPWREWTFRARDRGADANWDSSYGCTTPDYVNQKGTEIGSLQAITKKGTGIGSLVEDGRRLTFPQTSAVSSARAGLTSLFGMGRGEHRLYNHPNNGFDIWNKTYKRNVQVNVPTESLRVISTARLWHRCLYTCGLSRS